MKLTNMAIGTRLKAGFALVLALSATLAMIGWIQIQKIGAIVTEINDSWMVSVVQLNDMNAALTGIRRIDLRSVLITDPAAQAADDALRATLLKRYDDAAKPYEATGISGPPEQKLYDRFKALRQAYEESWPTLRELARAGDSRHAEAVAFVLGESAARFEAMSEALDADIKFNVTGSATARDGSNLALRDGATAILVALAAIVTVGAWLAWQVGRSIVVPLHEAIGAARVIAGGDLSRSLHSTRQDETGQLLAALADMQTQLRSTIAGIQQSAEQVGTASTQIATGNSDLSARTERQASSLQETAASMEQLTTTVANGADSARQANELAGSATRLAERGGHVVGQVVDTMSGISSSSKRIGDIISVIDGIAFQTNILALNAAVEAARAGEQGRGFAVVASEVRTLARRSAEAAKEIKTLIQESTERVDAGGQLVKQAGDTMNDIVAAIRSVTTLISQVSAASAEQNAGIRLVNEAVSQLDQTTQQNAALVEQSAAAAESLKDQALQLDASIKRFKLAA